MQPGTTSLWAHRNLLWQLSRDGNLHGPGMSHATTASPKPSFGTSWRVGDALIHRNLFWPLSKDGHLHGLGMSHAITASPKLSLKAPRRMGDAVAGRGNAGWTTTKSGHPCPGQNCSQGPPAEKTGRRSLQNRLSSLPDDPIGQRTELS